MGVPFSWPNYLQQVYLQIPSCQGFSIWILKIYKQSIPCTKPTTHKPSSGVFPSPLGGDKDAPDSQSCQLKKKHSGWGSELLVQSVCLHLPPHVPDCTGTAWSYVWYHSAYDRWVWVRGQWCPVAGCSVCAGACSHTRICLSKHI